MIAEHARRWRDMEPHLDTLRRLAATPHTIVEFGVRGAVSTMALLAGMRPDARLVSVDIDTSHVPADLRDPRWTLIEGDDRDIELPEAQLVVIDTTHEYHHTLEELLIAASIGARLIALHDWNLPDVEDAALGFCRRSDFRLWLLEPSEWGLAVLAR